MSPPNESAAKTKLFESGVISFDDLIRGVGNSAVESYKMGYADGYADAEDASSHLDYRISELEEEVDEANERIGSDNAEFDEYKRRIRECVANMRAELDKVTERPSAAELPFLSFFLTLETEAKK